MGIRGDNQPPAARDGASLARELIVIILERSLRMSYFIIHNGEEDTTVEEVTKEVLLERITPEEGEECNYYGNGGFLSSIPKNDTNYWGDNILIIKGEIVVPEKKEVVTAFKIK